MEPKTINRGPEETPTGHHIIVPGGAGGKDMALKIHPDKKITPPKQVTYEQMAAQYQIQNPGKPVPTPEAFEHCLKTVQTYQPGTQVLNLDLRILNAIRLPQPE